MTKFHKLHYVIAKISSFIERLRPAPVNVRMVACSKIWDATTSGVMNQSPTATFSSISKSDFLIFSEAMISSVQVPIHVS